jgi:hypothetical protein
MPQLATLERTVVLEPHQLTPPERRVWDAIATGEVVNLVPGDSEYDSARGTTWGPDRSIRGQLLSELLAEGRNPQAPPASFLRLRGARITGGLDLEAVTVRCPVTLQPRSWPSATAVFMPIPPRGVMRWAASPTRKARPSR